MHISKELFQLANKLKEYSSFESDELQALIDTSEKFAKSWSGSWLGYHFHVYYKDFLPVPPDARFSQEWGFMRAFSNGTIGEWLEYDFDDVVHLIYKKARNPNLNNANSKSKEVSSIFDEVRSSALSLIHANYELGKDKFLDQMLKKVEEEEIFNESDYIKCLRPSGNIISRDMAALEKGIHTPPHIAVLAKAVSLKSPFQACERLYKNLRRLASHIQNIESKKVSESRMGTNIFIGHGQSLCWRDLKDFIKDRLGLPWDEFNRVPVAGFANIARLSQMLDQASFAFLILTAEDEQANGKVHARMNVIHEVGLFQGRLGFERAIVLLEEGCEEFTNIQGLGQIRYPKGQISSIFEDIRKVLEREGLLE